MPYRQPGFGGLLKDNITVFADGHVEIDGEHKGWLSQLEIRPLYNFRTRNDTQQEEIELNFSMVLVPKKPEPDARYNLAGEIVGYVDWYGKFHTKEEMDGPSTEASTQL